MQHDIVVSMTPLRIMIIALVLMTIGFANLAAVLPSVLLTTSISEAQAGLAGSAFFLAYAVASPFFAGLTDHYSAKRIYLIGCFCNIFGGLIYPLASNTYEALLVSRIASGLGMAGTYMPGMRLLIGGVETSKQNRAVAGYTSSLSLGLSVSFAVSGLAQWRFGWPAAFVTAATAAACAAILVGVRMPDTVIQPKTIKTRTGIGALLRRQGVPATLIAIAGNSWEGMAFRIWWVTLLTFAANVDGSSRWSDLNLPLATAITGLLATPLSAWIAARAEYRNRSLVIALAATSAVVAAGVLVFNLAAPFAVVFALSVLYACTIFADAGSLPPALLSRVAPADHGSALALLSATGNIAACAAVVTIGVILEFSGGRGDRNAWMVAILAMAAGSLLAAAAMLHLHFQNRRTGH